MQRNEIDKSKLSEVEISNRELKVVSSQKNAEHIHISVMCTLDCSETEDRNKLTKA